ncbi:MAG: hypothetical protein AAGK32_07405, partial [Actinomycetota bacterium]
MRRLLRILAVLGVAAAVAAVVRRLLAERDDATPPVAPWDELTGKDAGAPSAPAPEPVEPAADDIGVDVDASAAPISNNG